MPRSVSLAPRYSRSLHSSKSRGNRERWVAPSAPEGLRPGITQ
jgi:hypothetical protein